MTDKQEAAAHDAGVIHLAEHSGFPPKSARPAGAGGGNGGGMFMDPGTKYYIDSRDEATRAQNDARFAEVLAKLSQTATADGQRKLAFTTGIAIIAAMIALFAFGADRFGSGMSAASLVYEQSDEASRRAEQNERNIKEIRDDLKTLIESIGERNEGSAGAP